MRASVVLALLLSVALPLVIAPATTAQEPSSSLTGVVIPNPLSLSVVLTDATVQQGRAARLQVTATNLAANDATNLELTLHVQPVTLGAQGGFQQSVPRLRALSSSSTTWRLCSNTPGSYIVMVTGRVVLGDAVYEAESNAAVLEVTPGRGRCSGAFQFG